MTPVSLEKLCEELWEGLGGEVLSTVRHSKYDLKIHFRCEDWADSSKARNFHITCLDVAESTVCAVQCDEMALDREHGILWEYNQPQFQLFYNSVPQNAHETLGLLWAVHNNKVGDTGCVDKFILSEPFIRYHAEGLGLLARGAETQLKIYKEAVQEQVDTYLIPSYKPKGGYSVLWFEVGHVIARSFEIEEI